MLPVIQQVKIGHKSQKISKIEEIRDFGNFEHIISQMKTLLSQFANVQH